MYIEFVIANASNVDKSKILLVGIVLRKLDTSKGVHNYQYAVLCM